MRIPGPADDEQQIDSRTSMQLREAPFSTVARACGRRRRVTKRRSRAGVREQRPTRRPARWLQGLGS
jgi:hypothetical protein